MRWVCFFSLWFTYISFLCTIFIARMLFVQFQLSMFTKQNGKKSLMYCTHTNCCWAFIPAKHIKCFRFFSVLLCFCYCWKKRQHTWYKLHFAPSNVNHCNLLNKKHIHILHRPQKSGKPHQWIWLQPKQVHSQCCFCNTFASIFKSGLSVNSSQSAKNTQINTKIFKIEIFG